MNGGIPTVELSSTTPAAVRGRPWQRATIGAIRRSAGAAERTVYALTEPGRERLRAVA